MIVPKSDFRPNPARAVYVQGKIEPELVQRLTPQILRLQSQNRDPITVYIDSPGGYTRDMLALVRLLKARSQDYDRPCEIITVATRYAASAAADLLSAGDYALAYPDSKVLYHGGRLSEPDLTAERSSFLAQILRVTNESSAMDLAREIEFRFMFRFITLRGKFDIARQHNPDDQMTDLDCFLVLIDEKLSEPAKGILRTARERYGRYGTLVETVLKKTKTIPPSKTPLEVEAAQIKAIVDFEVHNNKKKAGWSFQGGGLHRLTDDFLLFQEYLAISRSDRFKWWCSRYGRLLLTADELNEVDQAANDEEKAQRLTEKVRPALEPVWSFFVALCHTLQRGENDFLSASDAYWMGLIDEVIGDKDLPPLRLVFEEQPDNPVEVAQPELENAQPVT